MRIELTQLFAPIPERIKLLYDSSFPKHEKRHWQQLELLIAQGKLQLLEIKSEDVFAGFITYWQLQECIFVEHFAMHPAVRGKGKGSNAMKLLATQFNTIVLEAEPASTSEEARKRLAFYKRLGYKIFHSLYFQPAYQSGHQPEKMELLYYNSQTTVLSFEKLKQEIYCTVYNTGCQ
ncbi:MAG: GNAT family N-acetyltransferase [Chitinophagaceae bacterium]